MINCVCFGFFLLYFVDYAITAVLIFPPLPLYTQHSLLPQAIPTPLFTSMGHACKFIGYSISHCTLHPHGYFVTTYLCFLISSPLHLFSHTCLPSGNHQNTLCVSVLLVCLVCFLDSIVGRFVFFAILLFIVLIFFLSKFL